MAIAPWPELNVERDSPTFALLHLASQMLGKIRVAHAPWLNHGWHVALQPRGDGPTRLALRAPHRGGGPPRGGPGRSSRGRTGSRLCRPPPATGGPSHRCSICAV